MGLLPDRVRSVVVMRDIQGLEYNIIAETMEMPLNSVKGYLHRGRKMLVKHLTEHSKNDFLEE